MTRKAKIWLSTGLGFVAWLTLARYLPGWLSLPERSGLFLFIVLAVIGLGAWVFAAIFLSKRQPAPPPPQDPLSLEMDAAITQTERRLVEARVARGAVLHKLPAVFVLGPRQHHKTSCVIRSGVYAELLAGDVLRGAQVVPTQTINTWYAGEAIVAEVGVDVAQTPERFARFLARFQPARLANALARGEQAPRAALVCYSCEALRAPGARDATLTAARELRGTLSTIARTYGIRLPVYVLFTKADDLPGFKEYARRFTAEEARDVLGATFPLSAELRAAEYADRASHAYRTELQTLFESLAARRVDVLAREDAAESRPRAYQFPRELRKLEPLITDFLVEIGRPSDLATSPFVRGFYFSGVREVVVGDGAVQAAAAPAALPAPDEGGATALLGALPRPGAPAPAALQLSETAGRREAQWVFLDRLLSQVVLNDAAALGVTRGGTRISFFRRAALGTAAAAAMLLIAAQLYAFGANSRLQNAVRHHGQAVLALGATPVAVPTLDELTTLDSAGGVLDELSGYARGYTPLHLRWGMYQGDALYVAARAAFFRQFKRLMFDTAFANIEARLAALSGTPPAGAQFDSAYARLKTYLVVTDSTAHASDALADVLLANWPPAMALDTAAHALARRQFARYATELPLRDPYPDEIAANPVVVDSARVVLSRARGDQRIYQSIIQAASDSHGAIDFNRDFGQMSGGALSARHVVPGAFTKDGWAFVNQAIRDVDRYLELEPWVLGPATDRRPDIDERQLQIALEARYDSQYVEQWRAFVRSASVPGSGSARDASQRLATLAGPQSPIMQLFALVNEHTAVDSADIWRHFEPIRLLGARGIAAQPPELIGPYLQQLTTLSQQMLTVSQTPPASQEQPITQALDNVGGAQSALTAVLSKLPPLQVELQLEPLLSRPLADARNVLVRDQRSAGEAAARGPVEEAGAALCQSFSDLALRRPFSREPRAEWATATSLAGVLGPSGALERALQGGLGSVVIRSGTRVDERPRAQLQVDTAALAFTRRLTRIASALYPGTSEPQLQFTIAPIPAPNLNRVLVTFGDQSVEFDRRRPQQLQPRRVNWSLASDRSIGIEVDHARDPRRSKAVPDEGGWTPFFFFGIGQWHNKARNRWQFDYDVEGVTVSFDVEMEPEVQALLRETVFQPPLVCPGRWVRPSR